MTKDPLIEEEPQEAPKCPDCGKEMELVEAEWKCSECDNKHIDFFGDEDED